MADIVLNRIVPVPMREDIGTSSDLWDREIGFVSGQIYLVKGRSGSGKTTLLNFLYGKRGDYSGEITLDGKDIRSFSQDRWTGIRQRVISHVFQDLRLFPDLTGWENLLLKNSILKYRSEDEIRLKAITLGIERHLHRKTATLSLGQQQRLAILRALLQPFNVLLLDEPFSHIDRETAAIVTEMLLDEIRNNNALVLATTLSDEEDFPYDHLLVL